MRFVTRAVGFVALAVLLALQGVTLDAITNGTTISSTDLQPGGQFGWLVRLENDNGTERCTGTVVGQDWVLSAYHCSTSADPVAGVTRAFVGSSTTAIAIIESLHVGSGDAALFHLAAPVGPAITPARIAPSFVTLAESDTVALAGWGLTAAGGATPALPASGTAQVQSLDDTHLALAPQPSVACSGDSGGPVFRRESLGVVVYGVISASDAACNEYTVAVANTDFASFAFEIVNQDASAPIATSGSLRTGVDTPVAIPIEFSDPGGFPLTFANITDISLQHGTIDSCAAEAPPTTCTFVPETGFVGLASFRYTVTDGVNETTALWNIEVFQVPTVTITQTRVKEPTGHKPQVLVLDVQLVGPISRPVMVDIAPSGGTATASADYRATPLRVVLTDRNRAGTYRLMVLPDALSEFNETITFAVTASDGVKVVVPNPAVTILGDRSLPPVVHFSPGQFPYEGMVVVTATISDPDGPPMTLDNLGTTWFLTIDFDPARSRVSAAICPRTATAPARCSTRSDR